MLRSLDAGVSGMQANQTKMDVIGNNIANVGTTAFKTSRARFQDMLSQNITDATAPNYSEGGVNASQIGLGVKVGGVDVVTTQGSMSPTNRNLDAGIDGEGYFVVAKGPTSFEDGTINLNQAAGTHNIDTNSINASQEDLMYTRDGAFAVDSEGNLLTSDGFRIMGYSLTNDSTTEKASTEAPNVVTSGGFNFQFGPGAELNGYTVSLGNVGAGTNPSSSIDTANKKIILNGDFTKAGALTLTQVQTSINNALSNAGIAQSVNVTGSPANIIGIVSNPVSGGVSLTNPASVNAGGFTFNFGPGSQLNGYTIALGTVSAGSVAAANVDTTSKTITINGDFVTPNALNSAKLQAALNSALSSKSISQTISVNGTPSSIVGLTSTGITGGLDNAAPSPAGVNLNGYNFKFNTSVGSQYNDYNVDFGNISKGTPISVTQDKANKRFIINGDLSTAPTPAAIQSAFDTLLGASDPVTVAAQGGVTPTAYPQSSAIGGNATTPGQVAGFQGLTFNFTAGTSLAAYKIQLGNITPGTATTASIDTTNSVITINGDFATSGALKNLDLTNAINTALQNSGMTQTVSSISGAATAVPVSNKISGGVDSTPPSNVTAGGVTFTFANGTKYNGYSITLGTIAKGTNTNAAIDTANKLITINGDFTSPNGISLTDIQNALNTATTTASLPTIFVSGAPATLSGVSSNSVTGGGDQVAPTNISALGFDFKFTAGSSLNGYTITAGSINAGTPTSATLDTANKKIIINGDFTTTNAVASSDLQSAINNALTKAAIPQQITVSGTAQSISGTASGTITGGTPVQSISSSGVIDYVDATKTVNAYDTFLKTLKIPDKIHDTANNTDYAIRTFNIGKDGIISAVLEDGRVAALGQIAMASFRNPSGLNNLGNNLYHTSVNSGVATFRTGAGTLGEDNSKGFGDIRQGMLEMSNVDLAQQFTDMIVTSRAFQANTKVITTGDEILQDILGLKR
ncbi:MAG: flagellar hook-basal body complex protein [Bacillota bacterium]|nr:flagellar hook-basal body complex protein [Bacillota bacterium]